MPSIQSLRSSAGLVPSNETIHRVEEATESELGEELRDLDHSMWANKINSISVSQLKAMLQNEGLSHTGRKVILFKRALDKLGYDKVFALAKDHDPTQDPYVETPLPPSLGDLATRLRHTEHNEMEVKIVDKPSAMFAFASYIVFILNLVVYGGYLRDSVLRGIYHNHQDIDVRLSRGRGQGYFTGKVTNWCSENGCTYVRLIDKGRNVAEHIIMAPDGVLFSVQGINGDAFRERGIDFDVNGIEWHSTGLILKKDVELMGMNWKGVVTNIMRKHARVTKDLTKDTMTERCVKMEDRGWKLLG